jgi:transcriptional antiterminator RfaH
MIDFTKRWYAIYTRSRYEKKVAYQIARSGIEVYLPLEKTMRQWSDRKKIIYQPLFRSYVFVRVNNRSCYEAINVSGAVCYVTIAHERIAIPDYQIEAIRAYLGEIDIDEPIDYFEVGDEVEVLYGVLKGLRGKLLNSRNHKKILVQIEAINQDFTLTVASQYLRKVSQPTVLYAWDTQVVITDFGLIPGCKMHGIIFIIIIFWVT